MAGGGFGFGKKRQREEENKKEMSNAEFEYLCYNAAKRVEQNREEEIQMQKVLFNKIKQKDMIKNLSKQVSTTFNNNKKIINPLEKEKL
jgi:hypothetical protein